VTPVSAEHIKVTPGTCGGRPRVRGTRIRVRDVVRWHEESGTSPDRIVESWPQLTLADVHAALAYYHDHRAELTAQADDDDAFSEARRASAPPSRIPRVPAGRQAGIDPVPLIFQTVGSDMATPTRDDWTSAARRGMED